MKLTGELDFFKSQPINIRTLLVTNLLFAIVLPIVEIFAGAYIMRNTGSSSYVMIYQLCMYIGVVITAIANGTAKITLTCGDEMKQIVSRPPSYIASVS